MKRTRKNNKGLKGLNRPVKCNHGDFVQSHIFFSLPLSSREPPTSSHMSSRGEKKLLRSVLFPPPAVSSSRQPAAVAFYLSAPLPPLLPPPLFLTHCAVHSTNPALLRGRLSSPPRPPRCVPSPLSLPLCAADPRPHYRHKHGSSRLHWRIPSLAPPLAHLGARWRGNGRRGNK